MKTCKFCDVFGLFPQSMSLVARNFKLIMFGIVAVLIGIPVNFLLSMFMSTYYRVTLFEKGAVIGLNHMLMAKPFAMRLVCVSTILAIASLFFAPVIAFFYVGIVTMAMTLLAKKRTMSLMEAVIHSFGRLASFSLLLLAFVISFLMMQLFFMSPGDMGMMNYVFFGIACGILCLFACFAIVVQIIDRCGFLCAVMKGFSIVIRYVFEILTVVVVLSIFAVLPIMLLYHPQVTLFLFMYLGSMGMLVVTCGIATLWLLYLSIAWVVFVTSVCRISKR